MLDQARQRTAEFQSRLKTSGIDIAVITDKSSIGYLAGFWGYLSVEYRPSYSPLLPSIIDISADWLRRAKSSMVSSYRKIYAQQR
ncbi:hypothetical protein MnTg03_00701 [bacterium MnTg03]|nr:hypothetical protein MnTg03_00701 [bacterium MnTg03]